MTNFQISEKQSDSDDTGSYIESEADEDLFHDAESWKGSPKNEPEPEVSSDWQEGDGQKSSIVESSDETDSLCDDFLGLGFSSSKEEDSEEHLSDSDDDVVEETPFIVDKSVEEVPVASDESSDLESCEESEFVDPRISGPLAAKRSEKKPQVQMERKPVRVAKVQKVKNWEKVDAAAEKGKELIFKSLYFM